MVPMSPPAGQQRKHRCKEQTFGLSRKKRGWDALREYHWNIYITICQCELDA